MRSRRKSTYQPPPGGFDFTAAMERLCRDVTRRLPELRHIDIDQVLVTVSQSRKPVLHGLYAALTPMKFEDGAETAVYHGQQYGVETVVDENRREMMYLLTFYLPRFMEVDFLEKLVTIFHELWHISPDFNGDLRRHSGRCYAHTHSQKEYDDEMAALARKWLALQPPEMLYQFLKLDFAQMQFAYGEIFGRRIRRPKLLPINPSVNSSKCK
ncbi:MAG: putative metallopeptidase [Pirellulaceae bacterium]|jgi:predicted metallopeptidase|nr:putative metallopeptidase [Pirellulaceae bacterium]MDP7015301.1 putative metallopeptidase [Pirellulaceae bacterium]